MLVDDLTGALHVL